MSELTNYYVVKSSDKYVLRNKLGEAKIYSCIESEESQDYFSDKFKLDMPQQWVVFGCPRSVETKDLVKLFDGFIEFLEEEDKKQWCLFLFIEDMTFRFYFNGEETDFTENEKDVLSQFFNKDFSELEPYLKYGEGANFLNSNGIPYIDMFDQGLLRNSYFDKEYSVFSEDFND